MRRWSFAKGHGTQNDFVLVVDREGMLDVDAEDVRWICDRRAGIGADGLLRAVSARQVPEWSGDPDLWFMDYRNADGSIAQMCGNGVRVFARYLADEGLAYGPVIPVATRAGLREVEFLPDGRIRVAMGQVTVAAESVEITTADGASYAGTAVDVGNPHAVGFTEALATASLHERPTVTPPAAFPHGVNVELVQRLGADHLAMRVHERGSGETRSCGTGTVAAAAAARRAEEAACPTDGPEGSSVRTYRVDVPGGRVEVELSGPPERRTAHLTGPAVIVASGTMALPEPSRDQAVGRVD